MSTNNSPIYTENTVAELEKYNFSYDNISKGLAIVMIVLSLLVVLLSFIIGLMNTSNSLSKSKYKETIFMVQVALLILYIIMFILLAVHYKQKEQSIEIPEYCNNEQNKNNTNCINLNKNKKTFYNKSGTVVIGGVLSLIILGLLVFLSYELSKICK
jgi:hypothetical protein